MSGFLSTCLLTWALSVGYIPDYARVDTVYYGDSVDVHGDPRYSMTWSAELSALDGLFFVDGWTKTESVKKTEWYSPVSSTYGVGAGMSFMGLTAGWEHYCLHPTVSVANLYVLTDNLFQSADTFYVKFTSTIGEGKAATR